MPCPLASPPAPVHHTAEYATRRGHSALSHTPPRRRRPQKAPSRSARSRRRAWHNWPWVAAAGAVVGSVLVVAFAIPHNSGTPLPSLSNTSASGGTATAQASTTGTATTGASPTASTARAAVSSSTRAAPRASAATTKRATTPVRRRHAARLAAAPVWTTADRYLYLYHNFADFTAAQCRLLPSAYVAGCLAGAAAQAANPAAGRASIGARKALFAEYRAGTAFSHAGCALLPTDSVAACQSRFPAARAVTGVTHPAPAAQTARAQAAATPPPGTLPMDAPLNEPTAATPAAPAPAPGAAVAAPVPAAAPTTCRPPACTSPPAGAGVGTLPPAGPPSRG